MSHGLRERTTAETGRASSAAAPRLARADGPELTAIRAALAPDLV